MSTVLIVFGAACVGLVVGALVTYFLIFGFRSHEQAPSPVEAVPALSSQVPAPGPAPVRVQLHEIQFHVQIPDGRILPVRFPAELTAGQLLTKLVTDANLAIQPPEAGAWRLQNESTGQQVDLNKTLGQNGVLEDARLWLVPLKDEDKETKAGVSGPSPYTQILTHGLTRCDNGHYYDSSQHTKCPYCGAVGGDLRTTGVFTEMFGHKSTVPYDRARQAAEKAKQEFPSDDTVTRAVQLIRGAASIDQVVGWLVNVAGPEKGKDYRIRSENNTIGRSKDMDICISGDESIVRERHATITFDPTCNAFYLSPGEGRALVYVNGEAVLAPRQLRARDLIRIGLTTLEFVPFATAESYKDKAKADTGNFCLPATRPATRDSFRCSVFHPEKIGPDDVGKIIAYVHLEIVAREVVRNASQKLELPPTVKMAVSSESPTRPLPSCSTVEVTVEVPGLLFDNDRASLRLWEDMQSVEFRFKPAPGAANTACRGWIHFWLAGIILADVKVTVFVADDSVPEIFREQLAQANAKPYRRVFPSYSHRDAAIVERLETYAASFGDEYLRDVKKLRSGEVWNEELLAFIKGADVFQLFWSLEAAASKAVEQEWRTALKERESRADPFFLRPVYWTQQPAPIPSELSHLHFARLAIANY